MESINIFFFYAIVTGFRFHLIYGRVIIDPEFNLNLPKSEEGSDARVFQTGATTGFVQTNSTSTAILFASGSPAGIINAGGTNTSFSGSSVTVQDLPTNTSSSVGGSLSANCGGGQLGTFLAGQQNIGLHSVGNCNSFVDSNNSKPHSKMNEVTDNKELLQQ